MPITGHNSPYGLGTPSVNYSLRGKVSPRGGNDTPKRKIPPPTKASNVGLSQNKSAISFMPKEERDRLTKLAQSVMQNSNARITDYDPEKRLFVLQAALSRDGQNEEKD